MRTRRNLLVILALVVLLAVAMVPVGLAQPLDQKKADAQKEVERQQERLEDAMEKYKSACDRLAATKGEIEENEANLEETREELSSRQAILNGRARAMYVGRRSTMLDVVVNARGFDEILVGLEMTKKIGQQDAEIVSDVKDAKANLENARVALAERKAEQEAATNDMAEAKGAVESELAQAKGTLAGVEAEIRQAMARRLAEAQVASSRSSGRTTATPPIEAITRRPIPPGAPHPGAVSVAYDQLGKPYVWGAAGPDCFDCSGLTSYCYAVGEGIDITRSSYDQANCGVPVGISELAVGDILGFRGWGHVGLYIGGDEFIHAPHSGDVVRIASLSERTNFCGAVRP